MYIFFYYSIISYIVSYIYIYRQKIYIFLNSRGYLSETTAERVQQSKSLRFIKVSKISFLKISSVHRHKKNVQFVNKLTKLSKVKGFSKNKNKRYLIFVKLKSFQKY